MKKAIIVPLLSLLCISTAVAGFSERKLESAKNSAAKSGKNIAFVFYQDYWDPNCPKCVQEVSSNNGALRKAIPRSSVVVVEIEVGDKDLDKLPAIAPAKGKLPRIVVTDAACEKVTAEIQGAPDRKKAKEFEEKVKKAVGK
jgi:hypothetical protein